MVYKQYTPILKVFFSFYLKRDEQYIFKFMISTKVDNTIVK